MLVHEERVVLRYLRQHSTCPYQQIIRACMPSAPASWGERLLSNLEWLGYVTVFPGSDGQPSAVQITSRGLSSV